MMGLAIRPTANAAVTFRRLKRWEETIFLATQLFGFGRVFLRFFISGRQRNVCRPQPVVERRFGSVRNWDSRFLFPGVPKQVVTFKTDSIVDGFSVLHGANRMTWRKAFCH